MGKKTTGRKRHLIVDTPGLLLVVMVTSATVQDRPPARTVLHGWPPASPVLRWCGAHGGYANTIDSSLLGWAKDKLGLLVQIVKRSDDVTGFQILPRRWMVERTFGCIYLTAAKLPPPTLTNPKPAYMT